jgi:hypothetical protein
MEPSPCTPPHQELAFKKAQEHNLEHPSLVNLITTKQNKLPSFIDRWGSSYFMLGEYSNVTLGYHCMR